MTATSSELSLLKRAARGADREDISALDSGRIARAKAAFSTRRLPPDAPHTLVAGAARPRAGDVLLARVERIRQHGRIELADGRRAHLFPGDEIVVCAGNRYAPDQFHAVVPRELGPCALVAAGGIAAQVLERHSSMKPATEITALGILGDIAGSPLNVARFSMDAPPRAVAGPTVTAVIGTSMNSGKTAAAVHLIRGLTLAGKRVGSAKITGTGAGGDLWRARDAGAALALDFTDAGHASTYCLSARAIEKILDTLIDILADAGMDAVVIEVADGLMHVETARLVASQRFAQRVDQVVFAAGDAMGAFAGCQRLREIGLPVHMVSGALTQSPLAVREAAHLLDVPVVPVEQLADAEFALGATTLAGLSGAGGMHPAAA